MKQQNRILSFFLCTIISVLLSSPVMSAENEKTNIAKGKDLAFDRTKGNCLACHTIEGGELAGTIGPPLLVMKLRFPERETMRAKIWDATVSNPQSVMPPFGKHRILSDDEIEHIVNFLYSL